VERADGGARVQLVSRVGCHLCEEGREVVRRVVEAAGESFTEVDVDADPELLRRYSDRVPVVLVDGAEADFGRLAEARLTEALAGRRWWRRRRG
jgi:hypothetical protein